MKFLIVFALCVAAATALFEVPDTPVQEAAEIQQILNMINNPETTPATVAALQQLLAEYFSAYKPEEEHVVAGPIVVENNEDYHPITVGPAIIDPVVPSPVSSPLVQIIVNVNPSSGNPVTVEDRPPMVDVTPILGSEEPEVDPTPVIVVEEAEVVEPVIVSPIPSPEPGMAIPGILN